ncbi:Pentatricopeptide repeat-containing protein At4g13650 [Linum perenne]
MVMNFKHRHHLHTRLQSCPSSSFFVAKDPIAIAEALSFSLNSNSLTMGTQIHGYIVKLGFSNDVFTQNNLIRMYTKRSHLHHGWKVFHEMSQRNVVSWALLISGAVQCLEIELALETYLGMTRTGLMPNEFVLGSVLKACTYIEMGGFGVSIHCWTLKSGFESNPYVGSSMLSFYCKMEDIEAAERIFESMEKVDIGCWNAILGGYAKYGYGLKALRIASSMQCIGLKFDQYTFISSLHGSSLVPDLYFGRQIHGLILRTGEACSTSVMNALMDMYTKNGVVDCAMKVFREMVSRDIVTWNTAFGSLAHGKDSREVVNLFRNFMLTGLGPNHITFSLLFRQCGELDDVKLGLQFCSLVIHFGLFDEVVVSSSLVNMFSRFGLMQMASLVVDIIYCKDIVIWNELISGYSLNEHCVEALLTFSNLRKAGVQADEYTYSHILETCCKYGCQKTIQQIHGAVIKSGFASHGYSCSSLIKCYAKLGLLHDSSKVFGGCERIDLTSWGTMISTLSHQGHEQEAIRCFKSLLEAGEKPDEFILGSILGSCSSRGTYGGIIASHPFVIKLGYQENVFVSSGLVDAYAKCGDIKGARTVFDQSSRFLDVVLYNSMMMAYAHHGLGVETLDMFEKMKFANLQPNQATFVSLTSACGHLGMVDRGCFLFESMISEFRLEPSPDNYGCLVDMFSRNGYLEDARHVIETMPFPPWPAILRALLSGCRIYGNKGVGEWAAAKLVHLVPENDATRALWLKVQSESGNWEEAANLNNTVLEMDLGKTVGQSWIEVHG